MIRWWLKGWDVVAHSLSLYNKSFETLQHFSFAFLMVQGMCPKEHLKWKKHKSKQPDAFFSSLSLTEWLKFDDVCCWWGLEKPTLLCFVGVTIRCCPYLVDALATSVKFLTSVYSIDLGSPLPGLHGSWHISHLLPHYKLQPNLTA